MKKLPLLILALSSLLASCTSAGGSTSTQATSSQTSISSSSGEPQEDVSAVRAALEKDGYEVTSLPGTEIPSPPYTETQCVKEGLSCYKYEGETTIGYFYVFFCNSVADAGKFLKANFASWHPDPYHPNEGLGTKNNVIWCGMIETAKKLGWADSQIRSSLASSSEELKGETAEVMTVLENNGYEVEWASPSRVESLPYAETGRVKEALSAHKSNGFFLAFFCKSISDAETFMMANMETFTSHLKSEENGLGSRNNIVWCGSREVARLLNWVI